MLPGVIGVLQATEAIKLVLGKGDPLIGRLLTFDALDSTFRVLKVGRDEDCPACGPNADLNADRVRGMDYSESCLLSFAGD